MEDVNGTKSNDTNSEENGRDTGSSSTTQSGASGNTASPDPTLPMLKGTCKWFNVLKGFGFLTPDDNSPEVFVHQSVLHMDGFRSLDEGEAVEFQVKQTERGYEATYCAGPEGGSCMGSRVRPLGKKKHKKIRCFNCGQYGNHIASKCKQGPMDKCCYHCKRTDHLIADCPTRAAAPRPNSNHTNDNDNQSHDNHVTEAPTPTALET